MTVEELIQSLIGDLIDAPVTYTDDLSGRQQENKDNIYRMQQSQFSNNLNSYNQMVKRVFSNDPSELSAQDVMNSYGTQAVRLVVFLEAWGQGINGVRAGSVGALPAHTKNADGTVTMT